MRKQSKYHNKKITVKGETYDSIREYNRYLELSLLQRAGRIQDLKRQVKFVLIPTQREPDIIGPRGGVKQGKLLEKECAYFADFTYYQDGQFVVEDTKGDRTPDYIIKRKLMLKVHGVRIREV